MLLDLEGLGSDMQADRQEKTAKYVCALTKTLLKVNKLCI